MGQGPNTSSPGGLRQQYQRAYHGQKKSQPQLAKQCETYLNTIPLRDGGPRLVLELSSTSTTTRPLQNVAWYRLDPNTSRSPSVIPKTLEDWSTQPQTGVDLLFSTGILETLASPRAHLRAIAKVLSPEGKARIEVRNLCAWPEDLEHGFLDPKRPHIFTPHALATMCSHAGLAPVEIQLGAMITLVCRRASPLEKPACFPGPNPKSIVRCCKDAARPRLPVPSKAPAPASASRWLN